MVSGACVLQPRFAFLWVVLGCTCREDGNKTSTSSSNPPFLVEGLVFRV